MTPVLWSISLQEMEKTFGTKEASRLDKLNFSSKRNNNNNFNKLSRGFFRIIYNVILRKNTNLIYNLI